MRKTTSTNYQNQDFLQHCPLLFILSLVGTRWKPYIIYKLKSKTLRFSELKKEIPTISERMLILSLKDLERDALVVRKSYPVVPPRVEYTLSEEAKALLPAIDHLYVCGEAILNARPEILSSAV
ncbi:MAG: transcriptional regulator, HxlR family [Mucilaginibacter sp.]|nr:transcriptional regulator, HxlR family [Mucilaginibacter sp.]